MWFILHLVLVINITLSKWFGLPCVVESTRQMAAAFAESGQSMPQSKSSYFLQYTIRHDILACSVPPICSQLATVAAARADCSQCHRGRVWNERWGCCNVRHPHSLPIYRNITKSGPVFPLWVFPSFFMTEWEMNGFIFFCPRLKWHLPHLLPPLSPPDSGRIRRNMLVTCQG